VVAERYEGTVEFLTDADVQPLVDWITAIPFEDWPQQPRLEDGGIRPAMVGDPIWHGMGEIAQPYIDQVLALFPAGCTTAKLMVSVVMPGHAIQPHIDAQPPYWLCRVHFPLTTNEESRFIVGAEHHYMDVGNTYRVNTEVEHSVENAGSTPRIHLMFDVWGNAE
jgi:hypothetical protein